MKKFQQFIKYF